MSLLWCSSLDAREFFFLFLCCFFCLCCFLFQAEDGIRVVAVTGVHFFFSSRRRHTRCSRDWSSDVCSSDLLLSTTLNSAETTTQNLLDTNFDNGGWSGTADGRHGSSVIAAEHDVYIESSSISLRTDASLTEEQIQIGRASCRERG